MYKTLGALGSNVSIVVSVLQIEEHIITGERHRLTHTQKHTLGLKFLTEERATLLVDQNKQSLC